MPNKTKDKYLLVKGKAGLGSRIESLLTFILYAKLSGRRLYVDWSDPTYSNDVSNAFHSFFQRPLVNLNNEIPATDSVSPDIWRGRLLGAFSWGFSPLSKLEKIQELFYRRTDFPQ